MRKFVIAPAVALAMAATAGLALASDDDFRWVNAPKGEWMSTAEVAQKLGAQGYNIREIEVDHGVYEASVYDSGGRRIKLYLHPVTGEVLRQRSKGRSGRH